MPRFCCKFYRAHDSLKSQLMCVLISMSLFPSAKLNHTRVFTPGHVLTNSVPLEKRQLPLSGYPTRNPPSRLVSSRHVGLPRERIRWCFITSQPGKVANQSALVVS